MFGKKFEIIFELQIKQLCWIVVIAVEGTSPVAPGTQTTPGSFVHIFDQYWAELFEEVLIYET